jgi:hypothetical protein
VRTAFGDDAFDAARAGGRAMSVVDAIAFARQQTLAVH